MTPKNSEHFPLCPRRGRSMPCQQNDFISFFFHHLQINSMVVRTTPDDVDLTPQHMRMRLTIITKGAKKGPDHDHLEVTCQFVDPPNYVNVRDQSVQVVKLFKQLLVRPLNKPFIWQIKNKIASHQPLPLLIGQHLMSNQCLHCKQQQQLLLQLPLHQPLSKTYLLVSLPVPPCKCLLASNNNLNY